MAITTTLRKVFLGSSVYNFNLVERDRWVKAQAKTIPAGSRILDVGAGSCPYRPIFSHCRYETHDATPLAPDQLRDKEGYGTINYVSDATAIPVANESFDAVLCTEVLEHVPEPIRVVNELHRILRPGGVLLLTAPLGSGLHQEPYHFYGGYTPYWYATFLQRAGFETVEVVPNGGFFKHYGQEGIRFCKLASPFALSAPLLLRLVWAPFWLLLSIWTFALGPIVCWYLDRFDRSREFTIGYHVRAVRGPL